MLFVGSTVPCKRRERHVYSLAPFFCSRARILQLLKSCHMAQGAGERICGEGGLRLRFFAQAQPGTFLARDNAVVRASL